MWKAERERGRRGSLHDITFKCFVISVPTRPEQQHRQQVLLGTSYRVRERVKGWWGKVANTRSSLEQCTNTFGHGIQIGLGRQLHTSLTLICLCAVRTSFDLEMIRPGTRRHMHNVGNRFATAGLRLYGFNSNLRLLSIAFAFVSPVRLWFTAPNLGKVFHKLLGNSHKIWLHNFIQL